MMNALVHKTSSIQINQCPQTIRRCVPKNYNLLASNSNILILSVVQIFYFSNCQFPLCLKNVYDALRDHQSKAMEF